MRSRPVFERKSLRYMGCRSLQTGLDSAPALSYFPARFHAIFPSRSLSRFVISVGFRMPPSAAPASNALPFVRGQDLLLPVAIIGSVVVMLVPLPAEVMDVLLAGNIALAVLTLLTAIYVLTPLEFSIEIAVSSV